MHCNHTDWTPQIVADHFEEDASTLRKLPPVKVQGYFNLWPDIVRTPNELMVQEPEPMKILATPEAISRLEQTFEWMTWITVDERKLIWWRASKYPWKLICRNLGCCRAHATSKWKIALTKISSRLNAGGHKCK